MVTSCTIDIFDASLNLLATVETEHDLYFKNSFYDIGDFVFTINANALLNQDVTRNAEIYAYLKRSTSAPLYLFPIIMLNGDIKKTGFISSIKKSITKDGKGGEILTIKGFELKYMFSWRNIVYYNSEANYFLSSDAETVIKTAISDQCGPTCTDANRQFSLLTIATNQHRGPNYTMTAKNTVLSDDIRACSLGSLIGWYCYLDLVNKKIVLDCNLGLDRTQSQSINSWAQFSPDYDTIESADIEDTDANFRNLIYVGGTGAGINRTIVKGYSGSEPTDMSRREMFSDASALTTTSDLTDRAASLIAQYNQTLVLTGKGLAYSKLVLGTDYNLGDTVNLSAYPGDSPYSVKIIEVRESFQAGDYQIDLTWGKPKPDLQKQVQQIATSISSVQGNWEAGTNSSGMYSGILTYDLTSASRVMTSSECIYNILNIIGSISSNRSVTLFLDVTRFFGSKSYRFIIPASTLVASSGGPYVLTITTGISGKTNVYFPILAAGTTVLAASREFTVYVDTIGNVTGDYTNIRSPIAENIFDYRFKCLPEYPDDLSPTHCNYISKWSAGVDGWLYVGATLSVANGELLATATATSVAIIRALTSVTGALVWFRYFSPRSSNVTLYGTVDGVPDTVLKTFAYITGDYKILSVRVAGTLTRIYINQSFITIGDIIHLNFCYVGDGETASPSIDNSGNGANIALSDVAPQDGGLRTFGRATSYGSIPTPYNGYLGSNSYWIHAKIKLISRIGSADAVLDLGGNGVSGFGYAWTDTGTLTAYIHDDSTHGVTLALTVSANGEYALDAVIDRTNNILWIYQDDKAPLSVALTSFTTITLLNPGYISNPSAPANIVIKDLFMRNEIPDLYEIQGMHQGLRSPPNFNDILNTQRLLPETSYNDIQFSVSGAHLPLANIPTWETFTTNTKEYSFTVDDYIDCWANEAIHGWKEGSDWSFHLHITPKDAQSTGANRFSKFTIYICYADAILGTVWTETSLTAELTIPTDSAALKPFVLEMGTVTPTGYKIGTQIKVRITRIAATGGTEYASNVFITQCGCHIIENTLGSRTLYVK